MKTFSLHWGSGVVEEEAQITTRYHRPTIQLLKFTEGKAKGAYEIRFCTYDHSGRFQRVPLIVDSGVRRGADVLKARALGATAAAIGRAALFGAALAGEHGARRSLEILTQELVLSMKLAGVPSLQSADAGLLA